jgi:hypothetical protein
VYYNSTEAQLVKYHGIGTDLEQLDKRPTKKDLQADDWLFVGSAIQECAMSFQAACAARLPIMRACWPGGIYYDPIKATRELEEAHPNYKNHCFRAPEVYVNDEAKQANDWVFYEFVAEDIEDVAVVEPVPEQDILNEGCADSADGCTMIARDAGCGNCVHFSFGIVARELSYKAVVYAQGLIQPGMCTSPHRSEPVVGSAQHIPCKHFEQDKDRFGQVAQNTDDKNDTEDLINQPEHYTQGPIEVIDIIEGFGLDYHLGNVIKYVLRSEYKGNKEQDLQKARWYLDRYLDKKGWTP